MRKDRFKLNFLLTTLSLLSLGASGAFADALHGFCVPDTCFDNGTVTPWGNSTSGFGFWTANGPTNVDYMVAVATPDDNGVPAGLGVTIVGGNSGSLIGVYAWTSGILENALLLPPSSTPLDGQPANVISNFLPLTNQFDPSATGYNVSLFDMGLNTLGTADGDGPLMTLSTGLPQGSVVFGFLDPPADWIDTASSGALFVGSPSIPEPTSLFGLGGALIGLAGLKWKRRTV